MAQSSDIGLSIRVRGAVQGVGFRPHVWRLAHELGLKGQVLNDGEGVLIHLQGGSVEIERFRARLVAEKPALARIDEVVFSPLGNAEAFADFIIAESAGGRIAVAIAPDAATCPTCLAEVLDSRDRRYLYPFANCTHCGPRLSIVTRIPYDRANTSMVDFAMCATCRGEYENPADRRFHAQPIACPECGPKLWLEDKNGRLVEERHALTRAAQMLGAGAILAIKGIGGFHLACDAMNVDAVAELRRRKRRGDKPFALMMRNGEEVRRYAEVDETALGALQHVAAPIVLMRPRPGQAVRDLAAQIAPGQAEIGIMLPYSPLHHLLMAEVPGPLVMTSGNGRDEPQVISNEGARDGLKDIADGFLMHDRRIIRRLDDSVVRVVGGAARIMRRGRGHVPNPLPLPKGLVRGRSILAVGGDLKNTFCLCRDGEALLSPHIGELRNPATQRDWREALGLFTEMLDFVPDAIAVDMHPDYSASIVGEVLASEMGKPLLRIQHHHAHIAACMAENGVEAGGAPILGVALDGLGMGADGTIWGGEFLSCTYESFTRLARFVPVALPGGDLANRQPWRNAYAHLQRLPGGGEICDLPAIRRRSAKELSAVEVSLSRSINAPLASSAGRLIDAVAAILDIAPDELSFEGEAAQKLEALALGVRDEAHRYGFTIARTSILEVEWDQMWRDLLADVAAGTAPAHIARRFHNTLVAAVCESVTALARDMRFSTIALSGGVFCNRLLLEGVSDVLHDKGYKVLAHRNVPSGDGGLSFGQGVIATARLG
ncbi:carbamoyltransferase HypF [Dongia sp.]|uniref:carbamoyltransferase HypF n=1 Tax=Dongia sp. TaxID=1977262 RepID=UPI0035B0468A